MPLRAPAPCPDNDQVPYSASCIAFLKGATETGMRWRATDGAGVHTGAAIVWSNGAIGAVEIGRVDALDLMPKPAATPEGAASHGEVRMRILGRRTGWIAAMALGMTCALSTALWAGGSGFGDDDHDHENEGPAYFGFVKDTNGATVADAKVTVAIKDRGGVITRTDALGAYRVPGFGKEIDPNEVLISCEKQGYKQVRVFRRTAQDADPKIPIETECTMQRA